MNKATAIENKATAPFLKWAGGKRWLAASIQSIAPEGGVYFEPFLGSAAMFFHCRPSKAVLSDSNEALIETYQALKSAPDEVFRHLLGHARKHSREYYYSLRSRECRTELTRAARFIYLNRTCWNGLYRVNLEGEFNVPKGSKTKVVLDDDDFDAVSTLLSNCDIFCSDFEMQIDKARQGDVVFADPPYTVRHKFNGFVKYNEVLFTWDDQIRLRDALVRAKDRGVRVLLTNADHESVRSLYAPIFAVSEVQRYSAIAGESSRRGRYSELIIS